MSKTATWLWNIYIVVNTHGTCTMDICRYSTPNTQKGDGPVWIPPTAGMSKQTTYGKKYYPDVRARPQIPHGWVFTGLRRRVSASARTRIGHASSGHWSTQTQF
jgi:hypothetical protein